MTAALYRGVVQHLRSGPRRHAFRYRLGLLLLDLDRLDEVERRHAPFSCERFNLLSFHRSDYLGPREQPLDEAVRDRVESSLGRRPAGAVQLLTQVRVLGYVFNPVSFYFCYTADGALDAICAEITNTPWNERHAYVLDARAVDELEFRFDKQFHVSPFFDLDQKYVWRFSAPGDELRVSMTNLEDGRVVFRAALNARRFELTTRSLLGFALRNPLQPLVLHAAIYWQALRLYLRRTPFFTHPSKRDSSPEEVLS